MNTKMRKTTVWMICGAVAMSTIAGCAAKKEKFTGSRTQTTVEESTFAAGAGRTPTPATSYAFAKILVSQGRDRDALYILGRLLRDHAKFLPAYNEMADIYIRADRLDDAIAILNNGLEQAPRDGVLQNNLGMCHLLNEDPAAALEAFSRAAESMPTNPTFRANRAAALALVGREGEAATEYHAVVGKHRTRENLRILARARDPQPQIEENEEVKPNEQSRPEASPQNIGAEAPAPPAPAPSPISAVEIEPTVVVEDDETRISAEAADATEEIEAAEATEDVEPTEEAESVEASEEAESVEAVEEAETVLAMEEDDAGVRAETVTLDSADEQAEN